MAERHGWKKSELIKMHKMRNVEGIEWKEISRALGRSIGSMRRKYIRIDWDKFAKNPEEYLNVGVDMSSWSHDDMLRLDAFLQAGKSYHFISEKINRTIMSVESKARCTNWKAWRKLDSSAEEDSKAKEEEESRDILERLVDAMLVHSRYNIQRLSLINEVGFLKRINLEKEKLPITFDELKGHAEQELTVLGFKNPENTEYGQGTYIIVGDSHGKHTKNKMFSMLVRLNKHLKPKKIIHVGHLLDDDNDISYNWGEFDNLAIVAKIEELKAVQEQRNQGNFNYDIIRESITLGDSLTIMNQDLITDYVKTSIRALDKDIFDERVVVNCHRLEFHSRCTHDEVGYTASPGSLCEQHVIKTVKQIDFTDGRNVKQAYWEGFSKYRRMRHMNKYWEQGILIVNVDKDGTHTIVPCPIKKVGVEYAMSYFNKIITSKGVFNPEEKIFVNADFHCDKQDNDVLDIQEQICKDYRPTKCINLGDTHNYYSLNHHVMDRGGQILDKEILEESAQTHHVLKRAAKWSNDNYIINGNHERFAKDFVEKYPQFGEYLDFDFLCGVARLDYTLVDMKELVDFGASKYIHGEIMMYGQTGTKSEKASRTFGRDVFIGHVHYPSIRMGCYSVGLTGKLDQNYNEPSASQWMHGFGLCNHYKGHSFPTTIAIVKNACSVNNKKYISKNPENWELKEYSVELVYDTN